MSALVAGRRGRTRAGGALHRSRSRRPVRLHADRARSLPAEPDRRPSSSSPLRTTSTRRSRWPTSSSATSCSRSRFRALPTRTAWCSASCRRSRSLTSTALRSDWVPDRNRVVAVSAPKKAGVRSRRGEACGRDQERRRRRPDRLRGHGQLAAAARGDCPSRARLRRRSRRRRTASPSGRCRTACESCSIRRPSSRTRSSSARSVLAARRSPATRISSPPKQRTRSSPRVGSARLSDDRSEQEARGQDRRRASRHRRDVRRSERPGPATRSRDDVPVDLSDVHAAARRCGGLPRVTTGQLTARRWPIERRCPTLRSRTRSTRPSRRTTCARSPMTPGPRLPDEPRQVAGVLQGPVRRRERLHVRSRRQLRPADDQAARRAISGQPSVAPPKGSRKRRRHPAARRRRREAGHQRDHAARARSAWCSPGRSRTIRETG